MKEEHPDWTVPEGRVNRLMVEMRQAALNEEAEAGYIDGDQSDGGEGTPASLSPSYFPGASMVSFTGYATGVVT